MGLREIDEAGKSSDGAWGDGYDYSEDLRAGNWDYAANGAAKAVDWASELAAQPSLAEVKADGAATAQTAASAAQQVSSAAAAVHAVDAASTARAEYKAAYDMGSAASAVETSATEMGAAASVTETAAAEIAKEVGTGAASAASAVGKGAAGANLTALESGIRASKTSALKAKAGKVAAAAVELASSDDIGEGVSNVAKSEAKGYAQRKITKKAASRMGKAKAARAARKAAKAAGNAGAVTTTKGAAASTKVGAAAATAAAKSTATASAAATNVSNGSKIVRVVKSLFKSTGAGGGIAGKLLAGVGAGTVGTAAGIAIVAVLFMIIITSSVAAIIAGDEDSNSGKLEGNEAVLASLLQERGLDDIHVAAIMGNFACETGCNPQQVQHGFGYCTNGDGEDSDCRHQEDYPPELIDNGQAGYGLAQWTYPTRARALVNLAASLGKNSGDMEVQVKFLFEGYGESEELGPYLDSFNARSDIEDATRYFHEVFENSADDEERIQKRVNEAKRIYEALVGGGNDIVSIARSQIGSYYYWAQEGQTIDGYKVFDCSGFVKWCYEQAGRGSLPHQTADIMNTATLISHDDAQPGDIVGWGGSPNSCYHVGIYIGDDKVIDASGPTGWEVVPSQYTTQERSVYFYGEPMFAKFGR